MTKEEIIVVIKECTAQLGHAPTMAEVAATGKVSRYQVRSHFGTHRQMLTESGVERDGCGYPISMRSLFLDWARVVRSLGKVPTTVDYERLSKYSVRPLADRFAYWREVPAGMLQCAREERLEEEWKDVLDIILLHQKGAKWTASATAGRLSFRRPKSLADQPAYGRPLSQALLSHAPTNEAGVVLLFGSVARELGFVVMRAQTGFPDCEAMREVGPNCWQRVRIEFEYESHSFLEHMHPAAECDLIVCWSHNWPDCPLEVLELQSLAGTSKSPA